MSRPAWPTSRPLVVCWSIAHHGSHVARDRLRTSSAHACERACGTPTHVRGTHRSSGRPQASRRRQAADVHGSPCRDRPSGSRTPNSRAPGTLAGPRRFGRPGSRQVQTGAGVRATSPSVYRAVGSMQPVRPPATLGRARGGPIRGGRAKRNERSGRDAGLDRACCQPGRGCPDKAAVLRDLGLLFGIERPRGRRPDTIEGVVRLARTLVEDLAQDGSSCWSSTISIGRTQSCWQRSRKRTPRLGRDRSSCSDSRDPKGTGAHSLPSS